jgi:hypothetical protein
MVYFRSDIAEQAAVLTLLVLCRSPSKLFGTMIVLWFPCVSRLYYVTQLQRASLFRHGLYLPYRLYIIYIYVFFANRSVLKFEVLTMVNMMLMLSWVMALCGLVSRCQRLGEIYCLHFQGWSIFLRNVGMNLRNHTALKHNTTQPSDLCFSYVSVFCVSRRLTLLLFSWISPLSCYVTVYHSTVYRYIPLNIPHKCRVFSSPFFWRVKFDVSTVAETKPFVSATTLVCGQKENDRMYYANQRYYRRRKRDSVLQSTAAGK